MVFVLYDYIWIVFTQFVSFIVFRSYNFSSFPTKGNNVIGIQFPCGESNFLFSALQVSLQKK